eukprot:433761_1
MNHVYFFFSNILIVLAFAKAPCVPLYNAADPTLCMPVIGLGTGGYNTARSAEATPEHWNISEGFENTLKWFNIGGIRWDTSNSYESQPGVAQGLLNVTNSWTTTNRSEIFLTSKVGPWRLLGYNETLQQIDDTLKLFETHYIDLLLFHWPANTSSTDTTDVYCNSSNIQYSASKCRQSTWMAIEKRYKEGRIRAIGVSNFEKKHLMDIFNLNSLIPSVNQFEFHGYWHEYDLVEYCQSYNILVNAYAPLGTADIEYGYWNPVLTQHPTAIHIGERYNKSASQVWLRWIIQQDMVTNPRSWNITHQQENLNVFDFGLNQEEMLELGSITPPGNNIDPKVCPNPQTYP